jgi:hypothetical protein
MLESYKELIKDEMWFLNYIYYRQGFKMGASAIRDCLINWLDVRINYFIFLPAQ